MAKVPDIDHLDCDNVYEPSEDSYLLMDALLGAKEALSSAKVCLEIGSGSGAITASLFDSLDKKRCLYFCTDINPLASEATGQTAAVNGVLWCEQVCCDLFAPLEQKLHGLVDVLIFNPPYVPTPSEEVSVGGIAASWAGGVDGREVIDRALPLFEPLLSNTGVGFMVLVQENRPAEVAETLLKHGLIAKIVAEKRAFNEHLSILHFSRPPS